jgi:hypothetical protein
MTGLARASLAQTQKPTITTQPVMASFAQRRETSCSNETNRMEKHCNSHGTATTQQDVSVPIHRKASHFLSIPHEEFNP